MLVCLVARNCGRAPTDRVDAIFGIWSSMTGEVSYYAQANLVAKYKGKTKIVGLNYQQITHHGKGGKITGADSVYSPDRHFFVVSNGEEFMCPYVINNGELIFMRMGLDKRNPDVVHCSRAGQMQVLDTYQRVPYMAELGEKFHSMKVLSEKMSRNRECTSCLVCTRIDVSTSISDLSSHKYHIEDLLTHESHIYSYNTLLNKLKMTNIVGLRWSDDGSTIAPIMPMYKETKTRSQKDVYVLNAKWTDNHTFLVASVVSIQMYVDGKLMPRPLPELREIAYRQGLL